jgi:3-oxoacyl-[acyl-carrier-protein] synthase II
VIPLAISGWSVLSSAGMGRDCLVDTLKRDCTGEPDRGRDVQALYPEALPSATAHAIVDFDVRQILGRKGTSFLDRRSALAMVACGQALEDSGTRVDDSNRHRIGIVLGTTLGSLKSMNDYTRETLVEERPYLVNPVFFPNTVMNCAAGQAAIRYKLKGVNATLAGGELAFLNVLRYSANLLRCSYADVLLMGAVEEFTPHAAWATHLGKSGGADLPAGEGAAVFVTHLNGDAKPDRNLDGEILSVITAFAPSTGGQAGMARAIERCIRRALAEAHISAQDITFIATSETGSENEDWPEKQALASVFGSDTKHRIAVKKLLGECQAATGALQLAALLTLHHDNSDLNGRISLVCSWMPDGGVGAAVLRGRRRGGSDHR